MSETFADRDGWIWQDGGLVPWRQARLHVLSHGLHYASSVFEGIRVYGGEPFLLTEHHRRLHSSAGHLGFALPFSVSELDAAAREVVAANRIDDGYLRPVAWCGSDTMSLGDEGNHVHVAIAGWPWPNVFGPRAGEVGIRLGTSAWRRPSPACAPVAAKAAAHYSVSSLAHAAAKRAGYDDALLLSHTGHLAEATGANLVLVMDGALHTPICDGFLDGITRRVAARLARRAGLTVIERHIPPTDLARAAEVFLTGTAYEIQPVTAVDGVDFPIGPVTRLIREGYTAEVRAPSESVVLR
ncbi:branched-chain amino acid transaminase [Micromonospora sp. NPDC051196]|uniref:branched-chain amino acid transaminase n=1 Tax=Micromonospora sp. NPDC051196 TaxID=3155281 RepID=UPI0034248430